MRVTDPVVNQFLEPDHEFDFNPVNRNLCFGGGGGVFKPIVIKNITPNLDQDLTKANNQTIQNAAINAASDVQAAAQKLGTDTQKEAISTASNVQAAATKAATDVQKETILTGGNIQAAATKAGSDIQEAAVKAGSDVQAGVSDIVNQTGIKNETIEKIISSNVKGAEASLDTAVKGAEAEISKNVKGTEASLNTAVKGLEGEIAKNVAGGKGTLQTNVKGAEAELEKNVNGLEGTIEDFTESIEEIGTILTQPFQKETTPTDEPADTTVTPEENTGPSPLPGPTPEPTFADDMTAQERKSRNRLLQAGRYGRQKTILTGGSGISGYGY